MGIQLSSPFFIIAQFKADDGEAQASDLSEHKLDGIRTPQALNNEMRLTSYRDGQE